MGYKSVKNMSRKQQKAVFARMGDGRTSFTNQDKSNRTKLLREMSYKDLKAKGHKFKSKDADKDGVPNSKDCKPLDRTKQDKPKKLGILRKLKIAAFKQSLFEQKLVIRDSKEEIKYMQGQRKYFLKRGETVEAQEELKDIQALKSRIRYFKKTIKKTKLGIKDLEAGKTTPRTHFISKFWKN